MTLILVYCSVFVCARMHKLKLEGWLNSALVLSVQAGMRAVSIVMDASGLQKTALSQDSCVRARLLFVSQVHRTELL